MIQLSPTFAESSDLSRAIPNLVCMFAAYFFRCLLLLGLTSSAVWADDHREYVENGIVNLAEIKQDKIHLNGLWGFHWGVLLNAEQWQSPQPPFFRMPSTWDADGLAGYQYPGMGVASFTLEIVNVPPAIEWALLLPEITTAYKLIVNGKTLSKGGEVSQTAEGFAPYHGNRIIALPPPKQERYQIILQVANFAHFNGGPWQTLTLRPIADALDREDRQRVTEAVVATLLLIMAFLLIAEYFMDPRDRTGFWLGLLSLDLGIRLGIHSSGPLYWLFGIEVPWSVHISLSYVTMVFAPVLFFGWFKSVFSGDIPEGIFTYGSIPFLLISLFVLLTPAATFTAWLKFFSFMVLLAMLVGIWYLIIVVLRRRRNAWLLLLGVGFLCISTVHDMMLNNQVISGARWLQFGFLIFMLSQIANFLTLRVWQRRQIEVLSSRLKKNNAELERRVAMRTQDLSEKAEELSVVNEQLKVLANIDGLTGILNRRAFIECLEATDALEKTFAIILIDLDYFKQVNDQYGHSAGDEVLKQTGELLNRLRRGHDAVGRIGGEEFAVLLLDCDEDGAKSFITRFQQGLTKMDLSAWPGLNVVTASMGVVISGLRKTTGMAMLHAADEAMYSVKKNGRNGYHLKNMP